MKNFQIITLILVIVSAVFGTDPQFSQTPVKIPLFYGLEGNGASPAFVDMDSDGDLDVVFHSSWNNPLEFFLNTGTDEEPLFVLDQNMFAFLNRPWIYSFRFFDYDLDGDQDLGVILARFSNDLALIYRNEGTPQVPVWVSTPDTLFNEFETLSEFYMVDLVGDSIPEVLIAGQDSQFNEYILKLYRQSADSLIEIPNYLALTDTSFATDKNSILPYCIHFITVPPDSQPSLLINYYWQEWIGPGGMFWETYVYKNIGTVSQPLWQPFSHRPFSCIPIDYKNPNLPLACYYEIHSFGVYYKEMIINPGSIGLITPYFWMKSGNSYFTDLTAFDWKQNGWQDVVLINNTLIDDPSTSFNDGMDFYMCIPDFVMDTSVQNYDFDPSFPLNMRWDSEERPYIDFADMDDDGDSDLLFVKMGKYKLFWNTGTDSFPVWATGVNLNFNHSYLIHGVSLKDFDQDGDFDLIMSYRRNSNICRIGLFENTGTPQVPNFMTTSAPLCSLIFAHPDFADLDHDGDLDMVAKYGMWGSEKMDYFRNDSYNSNWIFTKVDSVLPSNLPAGAPYFVDADYDGDEDLLILTLEGKMFLLENQSPLGVGQSKRDAVHTFLLKQNYPNPFNPVSTIEYILPSTSFAKLEIFSLLGRRVRTLVNGRKPAGTHQVVWDGRDDAGREVASGIYLYRLKTSTGTLTRKMFLLR